jgi:sodium-independent sulfate anion transporter 11
MATSTKVGHALAKVLGIKLQYRNELNEEIRRGESVFSAQTTDTYVEEEPRSIDFIRYITPNGRQLGQYGISLFPFVHWIGRYNVQWLIGDLVAGKFLYWSYRITLLTFRAGITIGAVVVPQSMAYAGLANLPVQYGLYTSFMGVLLYWFFATSKDITIGVSNHGLHLLEDTNWFIACSCRIDPRR